MKTVERVEQQIAVFGESGSGKTVLLSSFYGAMQEPSFLKESLFNVVADDTGQGVRLHKIYLGMRNSDKLPMGDRFRATSYSFTVKMKDFPQGASKKSQPFDAVHLVWNDYPGEWFDGDVSAQVAERRVDTFRSLLGADVAFLLIDGQRILDNQGEEERYLKSVLGNFRNGLLSLRDDILENGERLVSFPRIWILALSKSDLLPDMDVYQFRDLMIERAADEIDALKEVIAGFVEASEALSIGEDFMLLSSAEFEPGKIEVTKRVGVELILSLAAMLPFERHVRWIREHALPGKVVARLLEGAPSVAAAISGKRAVERLKLPAKFGEIGKVLKLAAILYPVAMVAGDRLRKFNEKARSQCDSLGAVLTGFKMDIENGERENVFIKSPR
ncbi:TRAFAC clade GTPase domain-containing protein [Acidipropionibacterium thoenii]|uniref:TRAFAC clade GTPase domain-containing protein n=1 Tax=Acidipropionibacterium thoenii TaxID=1751 RepID=UPI000485B482|nr:ATP/GTP-binding protein [Acidipropionibacterium thoenii]